MIKKKINKKPAVNTPAGLYIVASEDGRLWDADIWGFNDAKAVLKEVIEDNYDSESWLIYRLVPAYKAKKPVEFEVEPIE